MNLFSKTKIITENTGSKCSSCDSVPNGAQPRTVSFLHLMLKEFHILANLLAIEKMIFLLFCPDWTLPAIQGDYHSQKSLYGTLFWGWIWKNWTWTSCAEFRMNGATFRSDQLDSIWTQTKSRKHGKIKFFSLQDVKKTLPHNTSATQKPLGTFNDMLGHKCKLQQRKLNIVCRHHPAFMRWIYTTDWEFES